MNDEEKKSRSSREKEQETAAEQERSFRSMLEEESLEFESFLKKKRDELDELRQMLGGEAGQKLVRELSDELDSMAQEARSRCLDAESMGEKTGTRKNAKESG